MLALGEEGAWEHAYLTRTSLSVLLLDLNFADIAGMLNDFRYVCLVSSSNFAGNALAKVRESTIHPVLPEDTDSIAEGRKIGFDHTEGAVNGPKDEEDDE